MKKIIFLSTFVLLCAYFSFVNAQTDEHIVVCFCHNIINNPHTICTDDDGLIQGHSAHVQNGFDSLGECPITNPTIAPTIIEPTEGKPTITINPTIVIPTVVIEPTEISELTKAPTKIPSPTNKPTNSPRPTKFPCLCGGWNFGCGPVCTLCPKLTIPSRCNNRLQSCPLFPCLPGGKCDIVR